MTMLEYQLLKDYDYLIKIKIKLSKKEIKKMMKDKVKR